MIEVLNLQRRGAWNHDMFDGASGHCRGLVCVSACIRLRRFPLRLSAEGGAMPSHPPIAIPTRPLSSRAQIVGVAITWRSTPRQPISSPNLRTCLCDRLRSTSRSAFPHWETSLASTKSPYLCLDMEARSSDVASHESSGQSKCFACDTIQEGRSMIALYVGPISCPLFTMLSLVMAVATGTALAVEPLRKPFQPRDNGNNNTEDT